MDSSGWKRIFLGNAMDVDIDASSRVLIAAETARVGRPLFATSCCSAWAAISSSGTRKRHAAHEAEVMQSAMPDSLKSFSF